jgi:hypothetical protein
MTTTTTTPARVYAWHIHHQRLYETLAVDDGFARRVAYIEEEKPAREKPRRLRLLKLVQNQNLLTALVAARTAAYPDAKMQQKVHRVINALHAKECKRCPWDGKTIFPRKVK